MNSGTDHKKLEGQLRGLRHLALDMDGTIYKGNSLFPFTNPFLKLLRELEIGYTFLTNNPSKSVADYLGSLSKMGISATEDQLYTSTQATIEYLQRQHPKARKLFVLGTPSMGEQFIKSGFVLLPDDPKAAPDLVVVGFDMTLTYSRLCRAAWWIRNDIAYVATNPDMVCPTDQPTVLVDCGSIVAAIEAATGRKPEAVMGKPDPSMITGILRRHGIKPEELAMVGDRLYTDIEMARRAGALGILVLTGEATEAQAAGAFPGPDLVVKDLSCLGSMLRQVRLANALA